MLQVAFALGKGVQETRYKAYWDVELGVTYIPWDDIPDNLQNITQGGVIDEDTLPDHMRGNKLISNINKSKSSETNL